MPDRDTVVKTSDQAATEMRDVAVRALALIDRWRSSGTRIAFGHYRVKDGAIQTGTASLRESDSSFLILDTGGSRLRVRLDGARYEFGSTGFIRGRDYRDIVDIEGLSITLANTDWLLLFEDWGDLDPLSLTAPIRFRGTMDRFWRH